MSISLRRVTTALIPHLPPIATIWEPAAGSGLRVEALRCAGFAVIATDIATGDDFLLSKANGAAAIITNPPYALAQEFIEHGAHGPGQRCGGYAPAPVISTTPKRGSISLANARNSRQRSSRRLICRCGADRHDEIPPSYS